MIHPPEESAAPRPRLPWIQKIHHPETDIHAMRTACLYIALADYFRDASDVYVASNRPLHYEADNPTVFVAPDLFVVKGVKKGNRRAYKLWEEKKSPDIIIEITSHSAWLEDMGMKRALYAELGVAEYFIYDPLKEYLKPTLQGFRLKENEYISIAPDASEKFHSDVLNLDLQVVGGDLRVLDPSTGKYLLTPAEAQEAARRAEAELEQLRAEMQGLRDRKGN